MSADNDAKVFLNAIEAMVGASEPNVKSVANDKLVDLDDSIRLRDVAAVHAAGTMKWIWANYGAGWYPGPNSQRGGEACGV